MVVKYDEEDLGLILLCFLPSSYSNFRDTILYSRDILTLNEVYEALQDKKKKMKNKWYLLKVQNHKQKACLFVVGLWREDPLVDLEVRVQMAIGAVHSLEAKAKSSAITTRKPLIIYLSIIN